MPDTNTLYYTFSTMAQTLSGTIALLGAFILYKLQAIHANLDAEIAGLIQLYKENRTLTQMYLTETMTMQLTKNYKGIISHINNPNVLQFIRSIHQRGPESPFEQRCISLNHFWSNRTSIIRSFILSLNITIVVIVLSILMLNFTPIIPQTFYLLALGLGTATLTFCLILVGITIRRSIKD